LIEDLLYHSLHSFYGGLHDAIWSYFVWMFSEIRTQRFYKSRTNFSIYVHKTYTCLDGLTEIFV